MSNLLTACCCQGECDDLCPDDGEDDPCVLGSLNSSYSISVSASWTGSNPSGSTSASIDVDAGTHTDVAPPACVYGGSQSGQGNWGWKAKWWKAPLTQAFSPAITIDIDWAGGVGGSCNVSRSSTNDASLNGFPSVLSNSTFTLKGLALYHEYHCNAKPPISMYFYVYAITYASSVATFQECGAPAIRPWSAEICFYSTPTTTCSVSPDDVIDWQYQAPASGTLAARSQLIANITSPARMSNTCYLSGDCANFGGTGQPTSMAFSLGVT